MHRFLINAKTARKFCAMFTEEEYQLRRIKNTQAPKSFEDFKCEVTFKIDNFTESKVRELHELVEDGDKVGAINAFFKNRKQWISNQPDSEILSKRSQRQRASRK
jgi:hypothetical protein